jgi:hypothetical protein
MALPDECRLALSTAKPRRRKGRLGGQLQEWDRCDERVRCTPTTDSLAAAPTDLSMCNKVCEQKAATRSPRRRELGNVGGGPRKLKDADLKFARSLMGDKSEHWTWPAVAARLGVSHTTLAGDETWPCRSSLEQQICRAPSATNRDTLTPCPQDPTLIHPC